jgi:hypothetical protein
MSLLRRTKAKTDQNAITASGRYVDLRDREVVQTLAMTRMAWQPVAWNYRNSIGELGQALRMKANIISKVMFTAATNPQGDDEPVLLTGDPEKDRDEDKQPYVPDHVAQAAIECLAKLPWETGYSWTGRIVTGFDVPGEVWLHGFPDENQVEQWRVRSTSEVMASAGGGLAVVDVPGKGAREINAETETLIRLWVPHPEYGELADSALRTLLDVCEDVVLAGREMRAASMSRIASNGILKVPEGITMVRDGEPTARPENSHFMAGFTAAVTAPINNEGHVSAVVPILVTGDPEDLKAMEHMEIVRTADASAPGRLKDGLDRIADSLDLPREAMKGTLGESNHWTAWLIDAQTFKNHLEPGCKMIADSITESYMRRRLMEPAPLGWGLTLEEAKMVRCWFDASAITENANRSKDADDAMALGAISFKSYRGAKGFDEGDAPDEEDLQQLMMIKSSRPDPNTLAQLSALLLGTKEFIPSSDRQVDMNGNPVGPPVITNAKAPAIEPGQTPAQGTPPVPAGVTAAGAQGVLDSVRLIDSQTLADLDYQLIERIRQAAEVELTKALERAGSKIRAQVQGKDKALALQLKGVDPATVGELVGYDRVHELGLTEDILLAAAFAYLSAKFAVWTLATVKASAMAVSQMVGLPLVAVNALATSMAARIPGAWKRLEASLHERAMNALYGRKGDQLPDGEVPDTIILPGDIRAALAEIGGAGEPGSPGGLATGGDIMREIDNRASRVGFSWRYGITVRERQFHPHRELAGQRFEGFEDPALATDARYAWLGAFFNPGDHKGCMCDAVYTWMIDDADREAARLVNEETGAMASERLLAELDDAAGRTGTHSQRTRDERDRIVEVTNAWREGRAPR